MIQYESEQNKEKVCDLNYLAEMTGGKKHLMKEIMDVFLKQVPDELQVIHDAIVKKDYVIMKNVTHTMRSSVSIMGISVLAPVLQEMENLGAMVGNSDVHHHERIQTLNRQLNLICKQAIGEIEKEKHKYV